MFIKDKIALIDTQIDLQIPKECDGITNKWSVKYHGLCRVQITQNNHLPKDKPAYLLHETSEELPAVTIDDFYDVQIMHVAASTSPLGLQTWGNYFDNSYDYRMKLLYMGKKRSAYERVLAAIKNTEDTRFWGSILDTETVFRNEIKVLINQDKNYPPEYWAFCIYYGVTNIEPNIEDEDNSEYDISPVIGQWRMKPTDDGLIVEKFTIEGWIEKERIV